MGERLALVIGNSDYTDPSIAQLTGPNADATTFADLLGNPAIGDFKIEIAVNWSTEDIRLAIARLCAKRKRADLLLLYFSGHGILDVRGRLCLATKDTQREFLSATAVSASFISDEMDNSGSRRQVIILDCCHSGAFARGTKGATGTSVGTAIAFEGNGFGRTVLTATDATQFAWEGDKVVGKPQSSVFTRHLIEGLRTGGADLDNDGFISLGELYEYVYEGVLRDTPSQTPSKWAFKQQGDIILARSVRPRLSVAPVSKIDVPSIVIQSKASSRVWQSPDRTVFREILGGDSVMGGNKYPDERPVHKVHLSTFFMASTPVTNAQFFQFCEETKYRGGHRNFLLHLHRKSLFPAEWRKPDAPVVFITWQDAKEYILWRCEKDDRDYRLPSEAQWEYGCRAGTRTVYYWGNEYNHDLLNADQIHQYSLPVKSYPPNPWGLFDMLGNVWEWCEDVKDVNHWEQSVFYHHCRQLSQCADPVNTDPKPMFSKTAKKEHRVIRGGSWYSESRNVRPANRRGQDQSTCTKSIGFRLVAYHLPENEIAELPVSDIGYLTK